MPEALLSKTKEAMEAAFAFLQIEFSRLKIGRASVSMIDGVKVDNYGQLVPINLVATISCSDVKTILIKPWEKRSLHAIEKAITNSKLGFNPQNNGDIITLSLPPITQERRVLVAKQAKEQAENAKISVRNVRKPFKDAMKRLSPKPTEDMVKDFDEKLQKATAEFIKKIDDLLQIKEKEILTL